jgi:hypothetical protein
VTRKKKLLEMKWRSRNWEKPEINFLVELKVEMQSRFNQAKIKHKILWEEISRKMIERGYERSAEVCLHKWTNLVRGCKNRRENEPLRDVYNEVEKLCKSQPSNGSGKCFFLFVRAFEYKV